MIVLVELVEIMEEENLLKICWKESIRGDLAKKKEKKRNGKQGNFFSVITKNEKSSEIKYYKKLE